jgi:hypothetical protein
MKSAFLTVILQRFLLIFILGFILTLPFKYYFFPNIGQFLQPIVSSFVGLFIENEGLIYHSDGVLMQIWVMLLLVISLLGSLIWSFFKPNSGVFLLFWINRICAYFLALMLLIYGLNKIFKYQFYFPEPNLLFTPLGQLSPDILFWSSMGTSHSYSIFAGVIEVMPAVLLLFRKTRILGAFIAFAVLLNVLMLNVGFGITVKLFSSFLLLLSLLLIFPYLKQFVHYFMGKEVRLQPEPIPALKNERFNRFYPLLKGLVIGLILFESLGMYFEGSYFNGDQQPKPFMHGAYEVQPNQQGIQRLFFHKDNYFITQSFADEFRDYPLRWNGNSLLLTNQMKEKAELDLRTLSADKFELTGVFFGDSIAWKFNQIDLEGLAIFQ